ncbi:MAG: metallophosphoesterase, partial [Bacteroidota bacterium]
MRIIIMISILLLLLGSSGYYVYIRATQAFPSTFVKSAPMLILYIFLLSSFFIGKIVEHYSIDGLSNFLVTIGSVAAGLFLYALLFVIFFDIIRVLHTIIPYPVFVTANYQKTKLILGIITLISISSIFIIGYIVAGNPKVKNLDITINKSNSDLKTLNIVAVSDIHLGTMVNRTKVKRLIKIINDLNPDLVLIGGDIIDDNINVVKHYDLLSHFKDINSKYGVYSCMGNHEYISRAHTEIPYFEQNGIHMLVDSTVKIDDSFYIIGRDDIEGKNISGKPR